MTENTTTPPHELPRQIWFLRFGDGSLGPLWYSHKPAPIAATPILLHDQDAIDELVAAADDAVNSLLGRSIAPRLQSAIARVKGGAK